MSSLRGHPVIYALSTILLTAGSAYAGTYCSRLEPPRIRCGLALSIVDDDVVTADRSKMCPIAAVQRRGGIHATSGLFGGPARRVYGWCQAGDPIEP